MGSIERKQRQKTEVRTAILQAAWQMVKKEGWQALAIRKIADAIEYSVPVIYDHFENKEAILHEFAMEGYLLLSKKVLAAKNKYSDPAEQLEAMAKAYWSFALTHEEYYQLMYGLGMPSCEIESRPVECECYDVMMLDVIRQIIAQSKNPEADAMLKYYTLWSMLHGLVAINRMKQAPASNNMNQLILKDALSSFILGLKG
jgi:AcrR family transcriptional regulator